MKYNFKKKLTAMLSATLAAVTFLSVPASALTWEGSSGGGAGGGDTATKNNYTIADTSATACGYRFSRVDYYGNTKNGPIDVACSTYHTVENAQTAYRFETKYNKLQLKNKMYSSMTWNTTNQWIDTDANVIGVALPTAVSNIQATVMNDANFDKICKALGISGGASDLSKGDKILVEPLFVLTLKGTRHVLTITEIGIWGGYEFGWDKGNKSTNDGGGSFGFIANYTQASWPSSLYTEKVESGGTVFWNAGWDAWGNGQNVWQRLLTFRQMVENGFGVGLAYDNKEEPIQTVDVDLYPTGVSWLDSNGNETYYLIEGRTYTPVYHFYNAGSVGVYARVASWSFPYWKDILYDDSGNASTRIYIGANSEYKIKAREPITITQGLYYGDGVAYEGYELNVDTIKHKLTIILDCTESTDSAGNKVYVQESNTGNNQQTYTNWFSPKEPSLSQWVVDEENAGSTWIQDDSINGQWKLYSGEQVNSYLWIQNNSSFNINIIDKFKAILGLDNNLLHQSDGLAYFTANGKEGSTWTRNSGVYRVKNTTNNTHQTLYLTDTAAEKSYAEGTGVNIADLTMIANNITLNQQQFFSSGSYDAGNGSRCIRGWDNNSRILTLSGVDTAGFWNNTFDYYFKPWTRYRVTVEYVSGSVSINGDYYACLAFQGANEDGGRVYTDIKFPNCPQQGTGKVCTGFIDTDGRAQYTFRPWLYISSGGQVTFNNYRVRVKIEEVSVTDWDMSYTRHIQGYSVVPTDLEARSLVLYNADTGIKINNGTVLKAGQKVYTEATFYNNTEVAVSAELSTSHNNNTNTGYQNVDSGDLTSRIQCVTSSSSSSVFNENCVIAPGQYVTVRSDVFEISAVAHNKITLSSSVYLKNLNRNTEYEYNGYNNTLYREFEIETPFKPSIVQANSLYRKGINVITSYKIKNDSKRDYGTESDIKTYGDLTAKLELYRDSSMTGTPFATVYCDYCVPANGGETLVWFEWKVPTDSPSKLYAKMICDSYNRYSSVEFVDNGANSKNMYSVFSIVQPKVTSTPDTTFAKKEPYRYESGYETAKAPSESEGLNYYGVTKAKSETEGEKVNNTVRDKETEEYNAEHHIIYTASTKNSVKLKTWSSDEFEM